MTLYSLHRICLQKTVNLLRISYWDSRSKNPFSFLPTTVVEELVDFVTYRERVTNNIELTTLRPLLTSGRIKHLDSFHWNSGKIQHFIMELLTEEYCKNLVEMSIPFYLGFNHNNASKIKSIILTCSNLVQVHLPRFVELEIFENCPHLRLLRFHIWGETSDEYFSSEMVEFPHTVKNLEVFSVGDEGIFKSDSSFILREKITSRILANCPKLISVGYCDSIDACQPIDGTDDNSFRPFQLRRCLWDLRMGNFLERVPRPKIPDPTILEPLIASKIQKAVSSCPFLEELVTYPSSGACLQHLESLEKLSLLKLDFMEYGDYGTDFIALLNKIGPRLRHLAVSGIYPFAIDTICSSCPNLISLKISGIATISDPAKISIAPCELQRLTLESLDEISLKFILVNCINIVELVIGNADCFDDSLASKVMERRAFTKLRVISIEACCFTENGMLAFLESVPSLKKVNIWKVTPDLDTNHPNHILDEYITKKGKHVEVEHDLEEREFFRRKLHKCVF